MFSSHINVAFVQILVPSYKLPMFQALSKIPNVKLTLINGDVGSPELAKGEKITIENNMPINNIVLRIGRYYTIWQKNLYGIIDFNEYDLIILPEGILYLSNYIVIVRCLLRGIPFGFYGHGYNHQRRETKISKPLEMVRKLIHKMASVIIVYSEEGAIHLLRNKHAEEDRIFVSKNTLDVENIIDRVENLKKNEINKIRLSLNVNNNDIMLIYVGRIEKAKNPEWVVYAVNKLISEGYPVKAVFVGDGSLMSKIREMSSGINEQKQNTITFVGKMPVDKVDFYIAASDICVLPGIAGLAIVHAFAIGKPFITIKHKHHGPEVAYIKNGENGIIAGNTKEEFYNEVKRLVIDKDIRERIGKSALSYAKKELLMENQIDGFAQAFNYIKRRKKK